MFVNSLSRVKAKGSENEFFFITDNMIRQVCVTSAQLLNASMGRVKKKVKIWMGRMRL